MNPPVTFDVADGVGRITLDRPTMANAIDLSVAEAFRDAMDAASAPDVRAVILIGTGRQFCAGGDVEDVHARAAEVARSLTRGPAWALGQTKRLIRSAAEDSREASPDDEIATIAAAATTPDSTHLVDQFLGR